MWCNWVTCCLPRSRPSTASGAGGTRALVASKLHACPLARLLWRQNETSRSPALEPSNCNPWLSLQCPGGPSSDLRPSELQPRGPAAGSHPGVFRSGWVVWLCTLSAAKGKKTPSQKPQFGSGIGGGGGLVTKRVRLLWPHGLYPARLLCPWDSPGKNAGVVAIVNLPLLFNPAWNTSCSRGKISVWFTGKGPEPRTGHSHIEHHSHSLHIC